jgi:tetratricopeptide (TPR) repeat protein
LIFVAHPIQTQAVTYTVQRYASLAAMFYMASVLFYLKARVRQRRAKSEERRAESEEQRAKVEAESSKVKAQSKKGKKQKAKSKKQRAKSKEQRAKSREQRTESKERRAKSREQKAEVGPARNALACKAGGGQRADGRGALSFQLSAYFALSILCGMLAFLSKQSTASLPAAIILVEYLFIDRTWHGWKKKIVWFTPAFIVFAIFVLYVCGFFSGGHEGRGLLEDVSDLMQETDTVGRWSYLCTQFNVLVIYIRLLFLPIGQNLDYLYPFKTGFFDGYTPLVFLFLVGLVGLAIWNIKKRPVLSLGIFWFFITLSVESSIFPISDALFEHRLYLPMFGFAIIVTYLLFHLLSKRRLWAIVISLSIIISLGTATYLRNMIWQDGITLWSDVLSKTPQSIRGYNNLGVALDVQGRQEEAIYFYSRALEIEPDYAKAHNNLGAALMRQGNPKEAISYFSEALRIKPDYAKAHNNLGAVLMRHGNLKQAISHFSEARRIRPDYADVHYNLGTALMRQGNPKEAISYFSEALRIKPDYAEAHNNMGIALARHGNLKQAISHFSEALRIKPDYAKAHNNLGIIFARQGNFEKAISHYHQVMRLNPDLSAAVYYNIACIYARQNKIEESIAWLKKAVDKGFKRWNLIKIDEDMENIRGSSYYKEIIK